MIVSPLEKILIGNDAGWLLSFSKEGSDAQPVEIGRDDYHGEIEATLPSGLEGGSYKFKIEGITDDDYAKLAQGNEDTSVDTVKLFLYWRDVNASVVGYLKNFAGLTDSFSKVSASDLEDYLVAELQVTSVSRKAGERRYEATIKAREKVFHKLSQGRLCSPLEAPNPLEAAQTLAEDQGVEVVPHPFTPSPQQAESGENPGDEQQEIRLGQKRHEALIQLGRRMEEASSNHYGRGMFLIRDGELHIGARRIPLQGDPKELMLSSGLIEIEAQAPVVMDRHFDYCELNPDGETFKTPRKRKQFKLTLKGRPDLKPGDVVKFDLPPEEEETAIGSWTGVIGDLFGGPIVPNLGELSSEAKLMYVASTVHKLGRKTSFVTTITGVLMDSLTDAWDTHTRRSQEDDECCEACSDGTIEGRVANAVNRRVTSAIHSRKFHEVGEVRTFNHEGSDEPPSQTETVWRGLAPADGRRNRARRLAIQRPTPSPAGGVAYTSPFAFGKCGLVLPRYPGTRVLLAHRQGREDDPIDVGALWESGHGPDSEPGDYWLILPVDFSEGERSTLAETATPQEHTAKVSQDLIDASGNRIIEIGSLTIRIGADTLKDAGTRPDPGSVENLSGTQIVVNADGSVLIKTADQNIELDAGGGDINMKANNINVEVQGTMDVS